MKALLLASTGATLALLATQPAFAQQSATGQTAPAAANQSGIQDIVVTAQRRSENLQRAAVAVSAVSGDELKAAGVTRPTDLTALVPALQVASAAGPYNLFYLRGVGNFNANAFSDSAIAFNFAGVYLGRPSSATGFFYDLERIEVVKGPQGTLYGRNATGGAINVIPKRPELGKLGGDASVEYGKYNALRFDAALNIPLGDRAAFRVAGMRVKHNGYMNDGTDDQNDYGGRASLRLDASETLKVNVVGDYFHQGGTGSGSTPLLAPLGNPLPSTFNVNDRIGYFSPEGQAFYTSQRAGTLGRNFYPFPADFRPFQRNHWWGISSTIDWQTPVGTLTVIPAYREGHLDYRSYTPGFQVRQKEGSSQKSVEARFATTERYPLRAIVGAFYYKEKTDDPFESYVSNWNGQFDTGPHLSTESKALFGRLTYAVTPAIRLNVGARQTWEDKSFSGQRISLTRLCGLPPIQNCPLAPPLPYGSTPATLTGPGQLIVPPFGPPPYGGFPDLINSPQLVQTAIVINQNNSAKFKKFTWRAGADWDITPRNLLYASFETGFKAGGFFFSPAGGAFQPEKIKAFTLGSKNRFFDNKLQLNAEFFYWKYSDQQISHLINIGGVPTFATQNVGKATIKGAELEARFAATSTSMLTADVQYLDAKYNEFVFTQANNSGQPIPALFNGTGCPTTGFDAATNNSFIVNCSGRRPANSPKWTINFGGQQRIPLSSGEIVADARAHYQTSTFVGLEYVPVEFQRSYWLVDGALTFYGPERRFSVGAFVNNLFDKTVLAQSFPTPGTAIYSTQLRSPRLYGVRAGVKF